MRFRCVVVNHARNMRIAFAAGVREWCARMRSGTVFAHGIMRDVDDLDLRIQTAAKKRTRAEQALKLADAELRALLVEGRAAGKGPSHMAKLTGFTREWVAKIAPEAKKPSPDA